MFSVSNPLDLLLWLELYIPIQVVVKGLVCAGKKIHELLLDAGNIGVNDMAQKYIHECQLMSDLRHPNITQFLGVFPPQLPTSCAADGEIRWEPGRPT